MPYCAVYGCKNSNRNTTGVKFYTFPKDKNLQSQWINACNRKSKINVKTATVCSEHFCKSSFYKTLQQTLLGYLPVKLRNIRKDAVPTKKLDFNQENSRKKRIVKQQKRPLKNSASDLLLGEENRTKRTGLAQSKFTVQHVVGMPAELAIEGKTAFQEGVKELENVAHLSTSNSEIWPKVFHYENGQLCSSTTMPNNSQRISSGETTVESEDVKGIHIKEEPDQEMEMESVPLDDSVADEVNPLPIEHVSVGEVDLKLEFEVFDEDALSSGSASQTADTEPLAVVTKGTPGRPGHDSSKPHATGQTTAGLDKSTLAAQLHGKTWIICSPVVGLQARASRSTTTQQTVAHGSDRACPEVSCLRSHPASSTTTNNTAPSSSTTDVFDDFGKVVAAKLRRMSANQQLMAEKLVHDVLFHGQMGVLLPATTLAPLLS